MASVDREGEARAGHGRRAELRWDSGHVAQTWRGRLAVEAGDVNEEQVERERRLRRSASGQEWSQERARTEFKLWDDESRDSIESADRTRDCRVP